MSWVGQQHLQFGLSKQKTNIPPKWQQRISDQRRLPSLNCRNHAFWSAVNLMVPMNVESSLGVSASLSHARCNIHPTPPKVFSSTTTLCTHGSLSWIYYAPIQCRSYCSFVKHWPDAEYGRAIRRDMEFADGGAVLLADGMHYSACECARHH